MSLDRVICLLNDSVTLHGHQWRPRTVKGHQVEAMVERSPEMVCQTWGTAEGPRPLSWWAEGRAGPEQDRAGLDCGHRDTGPWTAGVTPVWCDGGRADFRSGQSRS